MECLPSTVESAAAPSRIQSVDALRGAIILLMALDHVRDFTRAGCDGVLADRLEPHQLRHFLHLLPAASKTSVEGRALRMLRDS